MRLITLATLGGLACVLVACGGGGDEGDPAATQAGTDTTMASAGTAGSPAASTGPTNTFPIGSGGTGFVSGSSQPALSPEFTAQP
jgi:hypothetical protein